MNGDERIIAAAVKSAIAAHRVGRRGDWLDAADVRDLEDYLKSQPDEGDRRVFRAAWHVQAMNLLAATDIAKADKVVATLVKPDEKRRPAGFGTDDPR